MFAGSSPQGTAKAFTDKLLASKALCLLLCAVLAVGFAPIPTMDAYAQDSDSVASAAFGDPSEAPATMLEDPTCEHEFHTIVVAPTCTKGGHTVHSCRICEYAYVTDEVEATGHKFSRAVFKPSCTSGGYTLFRCVNQYCTYDYTGDYTDPLGHDPMDVEFQKVVKPTCTEDGSHDEVVRCSRCDKTLSRKTVVDENLGHEPMEAVIELAPDATCDHEGSVCSVTRCGRCGDELSREYGVIPAKGHSYGEWVTNMPSSCAEAGERSRTCSVCGHVDSEVIEAAHSWQPGWTVDKAPTYVAEGSESRHCENCDVTIDSRVIPMLEKADLSDQRVDIQLSTWEYTYTGSVKKPSVEVYLDGELVDFAAYSVTYQSGRKSVGTYKVTVNAKDGDYPIADSGYVTFKINPKKPSAKSCYKGSTYVTARWYKMSTRMATSRISGYEVEIATDSAFENVIKTSRLSGYTKTSKKFTGLKRHTKYYVHVRTYKVIGGVTYYSSWGTTKYATTS